MLEVGYAVVDDSGALRGAVINNLEYVRLRAKSYQTAHPEKQFTVHPVFVGGPIPDNVLPPAASMRGGKS